MKRWIFLLFLFVGAGGFAQVITGQVKDSLTDKPLSFVTLRITHLVDSSSFLAVSDKSGFFELRLKPGPYSIVFELLGYKKRKVFTVSDDNDKYLGVIYLSPKTEQLDEVVVKGKVQDESVDRQVIVVTDEIKSKSMDINQLLDYLPGVNYNRFNNKILVDGHENVLILVNGLEKNIDYIKSLDPKRVWKVEIIRTPMGKYALEGYAAIINIILRDDYIGISSYSEAGIIGLLTPPLKDYFIFAKSGGMNFNYTVDKLNFYTNLNFNHSKWFFGEKDIYEYTDGRVLTKYSPLAFVSFARVSPTIGVDYKINPLQVLSFEFYYNVNPPKLNYNQIDYQAIDSLLPDSVLSYKELNSRKSSGNVGSGTIFYRARLNPYTTLEAQGKYTQLNSEESVAVGINDQIISEIYTKNKTDKFSARTKVRYSRGRTELVLGTQAKYNDIKLSSSSEELSRFNSTNLRLLSSWRYIVNKDLTLLIGLNLDRYNMKTTVERTFWFFQPMANLFWTIGPNVQLKIKYRRYVTYPKAGWLNPTLVPVTQEIAQRGNPELKPEIDDRFSVELSVFNGVVQIEPYLRQTSNFIAYRPIPDTSYSIIYEFDNVGKVLKYGASINLMIPLSKKLIVKAFVKPYHQELISPMINFGFNQVMGELNLIYSDPKIVTAGLMYNKYNTLRVHTNGLGYSCWNNDIVGAMAQKTFFDNRLSFMLLYVFPINPDNRFLRYDQCDVDFTPVMKITATHQLAELFKDNIFLFQVQYRFNRGKVMKIDKEIEHESLDIKGFF